MIKLKSHVGLDMKLGGSEQCATIFVAETISGQDEHAEYRSKSLKNAWRNTT